MSNFGFASKFDALVDTPAKFPPEVPVVRLGGYFTFTCENPDGTVAWKEDVVLNGVNNTALNDILSVYFNSGTQKTTWYLGLINTGATLAAADTISSHAGWTEIGTSASNSYDETARPTWTPGAPSGQSITNPTSATFTMNSTPGGTYVVYGAFLVSNSTKGGTTGTLWATGAFSSEQSVVSGQLLKVTYTCSAASS